MHADAGVGRITALLATKPVFDGHNDLPWDLRERVAYDLDAFDVAARHTETHTDIPRLRAGGVGVQFWSVYVPSTLSDDEAVRATHEQIDFVHAMCARYPDVFALARSAADVERAVAGGRIASLIGMEGGHSIGGSLGTLHEMYDRGARYMTLTHNDNTPWADSATDDPEHGGLTDFGREVVAEMNRLGMLVDLSHVAVSTMHAALDTTTAPVMFSHSSARALCDHVRNVPDEVLARLPDNGGLVMVTFVPGFVSAACADWSRRIQELAREREINLHDPDAGPALVAEVAKTDPRPEADLSEVADHVEHVRDVAGIEHVGLGGDFDGTPFVTRGLEDVSRYPALLAELARRGWSDEDLGRLTYDNALRVLRAVAP
jgi:membrane dipeptidase